MGIRTATYTFSEKTVSYYFDADFSFLEQLVSKENSVIITDDQVKACCTEKFAGWKTIVIKAGEANKQQSTVDYIISELIKLEADRNTFIIGVGGGVVTDITGYAASVYMRGVKFGFVPTSVLAMVDASIGGKNGVDVGIYKNLVGLIKQPEFLLFDYSFLQTLPTEQWINGFAEIIKHACIKDAEMFAFLEENTVGDFMGDSVKLALLIEKNVTIKSEIVVQDEFEKGDRKLLNFGHTLGHAIENTSQLLHGHAVSIGMAAACTISEEINEFSSDEKSKVIELLKKYQLPVLFVFDKVKVSEIIKLDKKRQADAINFILLNKIGDAGMRKIPFNQLENIISQCL